MACGCTHGVITTEGTDGSAYKAPLLTHTLAVRWGTPFSKELRPASVGHGVCGGRLGRRCSRVGGPAPQGSQAQNPGVLVTLRPGADQGGVALIPNLVVALRVWMHDLCRCSGGGGRWADGAPWQTLTAGSDSGGCGACQMDACCCSRGQGRYLHSRNYSIKLADGQTMKAGSELGWCALQGG